MQRSLKDLVVLAADKNGEFALRGLLGRPQSLGIRAVTAEFLVHPAHDPGCLRSAEGLLRPYLHECAHALVVLDHDGCGAEDEPIPTLETRIENSLNGNGWPAGRAAAVVVDPELEAWVWSDSPNVERCLGWNDSAMDMRTWLRERGLLPTPGGKPPDPKRAMEDVLRKAQRPRSSAIYRELASQVSLVRCQDAAFAKLRATLQRWFCEATVTDPIAHT